MAESTVLGHGQGQGPHPPLPELPPNYTIIPPAEATTGKRKSDGDWRYSIKGVVGSSIFPSECLAVSATWKNYAETLKHENAGLDMLLQDTANKLVITQTEQAIAEAKVTDSAKKLADLQKALDLCNVELNKPKSVTNVATIIISKSAIDSGKIILNIIGGDPPPVPNKA